MRTNGSKSIMTDRRKTAPPPSRGRWAAGSRCKEAHSLLRWCYSPRLRSLTHPHHETELLWETLVVSVTPGPFSPLLGCLCTSLPQLGLAGLWTPSLRGLVLSEANSLSGSMQEGRQAERNLASKPEERKREKEAEGDGKLHGQPISRPSSWPH